MKLEPLEDWDTAIKATCPECRIEVRVQFFFEHLWVAHGIEAA